MDLLLLTLIAPVATAALGILRAPRRLAEGMLVGGLGATFLLAVATAQRPLSGSIPTAFGEALRVDGLSALVLVLSAFVGVLAATYGVGYLRRNQARGLVTEARRRQFHVLVPVYVFAMLLVAVSNNLGVLWVAVEATTLSSVFLVAFHDRDTSLEAAWKFLVLGGVGLGFALLGTVLLFASGRGILGEGLSGLHWTRFMALAHDLHPYTLRLGVMFALIGYGTKAGLAPMHTWKPDAYREAPSPAGILMAVGMLNGALYCLLRIHLISKAALGPGFSGGLLLALGLLSVLVATPFVLIQWNLKRLLAYSSIEHAGIMAVGFGLGAPAATFGALLHMTYHTLAKPVAFFSAGTVAQLHSSSDLDEIGSGVVGRTPVAGALLLASAVMIAGSPPFALFFSELIILRAGLGPHPLVTGLFLASLVVLFCGVLFQVGGLVLGTSPRERSLPVEAESLDLALGTTVFAAVVAVVSAFYLPAWLIDLIKAAARVVEIGA